MALAYSYLRMSNAEQLRGDSLRRQLERSRAYAEKNGLQLNESLRDVGVSAYRGRNRERGALVGFLDLVEQGKVPTGSYLIIESLDRLSRETPFKAIQPFLALVEAGIRIVTLSDEQTYDKARLVREPWGLMVSIGVMMRANEESKLKSERVGAAWQRKQSLANDVKMTARCPRWLRLTADRKSFEVITEEAAAVRRAFELTSQGVGRQALARILNHGAVRSPGGKRWYSASLARLLKSDTPVGTYQPHEVRSHVATPRGEPILGYYPQIISPELAARARAAMAERRTNHAGRRGPTHTNLFPGLLYCGICGARMRIRYSGHRLKAHPQLLCGNVVEAGKTSALGHNATANGDLARHYPRLPESEFISKAHFQRIDYQVFERSFLKHVEEIDLRPILQKQDDSILLLEREISRTSTELSSKKRAFRRWTEEFENDELNATTMVADRLRSLAAEIDVLEAHLKTQSEDLLGANVRSRSAQQRLQTIDQLADGMTAATGDDLYRLRAHLAQEIRRVVSRITFNDAPSLSLSDKGVGFRLEDWFFSSIQIPTEEGDRTRYIMRLDGDGGSWSFSAIDTHHVGWSQDALKSAEIALGLSHSGKTSCADSDVLKD